MDSKNTVTAARTYLFLADVGTVAPVTSSEAPGTGWVNVGHTTPDSLKFSTEPEFEEVKSAQSDYTIRRIQTGDGAKVEIDLLEWTAANIIGVYGGGEVTQPDAATNPAEYKFVPPRLGERVEKSAIIDVIDGGKNYRYVFPRVMQVEGVDSELAKGKSAVLPLRFAVLGDDGVDPWYLLTNDPAFDPAAV